VKDETAVIQEDNRIRQVTNVKLGPVWPASLSMARRAFQHKCVHRKSTHVITSVKQCARASYVEIYWFLSISTTDVTTCVATDAFCALMWPQRYGADYELTDNAEHSLTWRQEVGVGRVGRLYPPACVCVFQ
jgi:hypothetical protein